jgi:hypothetical protein
VRLRTVIYYGLWAAWGLTAFPFIAMSIAMYGTIPMWPQFDEGSTVEGTLIWAAFAAWIYIVPVALLLTRHRWHELNDILEK